MSEHELLSPEQRSAMERRNAEARQRTEIPTPRRDGLLEMIVNLRSPDHKPRQAYQEAIALLEGEAVRNWLASLQAEKALMRALAVVDELNGLVADPHDARAILAVLNAEPLP